MNSGNWALITGASGGIGLEIVKALAEEGYSLYAHYNQNEKDLRGLLSDLEDRYPHQAFRLVQADLSKSDGVDSLLKALDHPVECLVQNSGKSHIGLIQDIPPNVLESFIQLQIASPFRLAQELIPNMVRQKKGKIIFITSVWGVAGAATEALYSMVKGGQNSLVKALAKELAPSGISVNGVAPGAIRTSMLDVFSESDIHQLEDDIPAGRLGKPKEVAALVRFLTTEDASYINGQIISINGAWYT
ncbi:MAG: elongation factor P 5-aminopentanone reductase [Tuberibacillus sp.]